MYFNQFLFIKYYYMPNNRPLSLFRLFLIYGQILVILKKIMSFLEKIWLISNYIMIPFRFFFMYLVSNFNSWFNLASLWIFLYVIIILLKNTVAVLVGVKVWTPYEKVIVIFIWYNLLPYLLYYSFIESAYVM